VTAPTRVCTLSLTVRYDPALTDPEGLCGALDQLLETAMSTPGILEEYGDPSISGFEIVEFNE
jgi:hypothetical protein